MTNFQILLMIFLIACAIAVSFTKNILNAILVYMSFSLVMSVVWVTLESPDLAITEAAVGAGITSVLFFITLKKIRAIAIEEAEIPAEDDRNVEMSSVNEIDGRIEEGGRVNE